MKEFIMYNNYDLIVIGAGPAGLAAAIEAKKNGLKKVLVIEREKEAGGILPQCIHNGFGSIIFKKDLPGPLYAANFIKTADEFEVEILTDAMVLDITISKKVYVSSLNNGYLELQTKAIILAMGCRERTRTQIRIPGSRPAGVYTAGSVQRLINIEGFMPGKKFVILGSGDIGMIVARRLTLEGAKVERVLEALPFLTGLRRNYVQCLADFNIKLDLKKSIKRIIGNNRVTAVETVGVDSSFNMIDGSEEIIECDTLVLSVGLIPENELSRRILVELDPSTNGPLVDDRMETSIKGIFACGNVVNIYDLVDYVTLAGYNAGFNASRYVLDKIDYNTDKIRVLKDNNLFCIMPNFINLDESNNEILFQMRINKIIENPIKIEIKEDKKVIFSFNEKYARPAEMITLKIKKNELIKKLSNNCKSISVNIVDK